MQDFSGRLQAGVTLVEVLVALLVFAIGMLGAASMQLNALKHTDSALRSSQASFIASDMLERMRANPGADYRLASLDQAPSAASFEVPRDQDLFDFARSVTEQAGAEAQASISIAGRQASITLSWNDARAAGREVPLQTFTLSSEIAP